VTRRELAWNFVLLVIGAGMLYAISVVVLLWNQ